MTASRDPDRLIHHFLLEGEEELQDQVYDAVRAEIEQKRQRAVIGPWRVPDMNKFLAIGLGAAAVVVVLFIGSNLLGPSGPAPGGEPTTSPAPSEAEPSVEPSTAAGLPEGSFVLWNDQDARGVPRVTVTISAPGWFGEEGRGILTKNDTADPPDGAGMIWPWYGDLYVYGDACQWSTTQADAPATTVDELVAALAAQTPRDPTAPVDVMIDGYAGKSITLHVPDDAVFSECDQGYFGSWRDPDETDTNGSPSRYHQGPGQIDELWILDVDGLLTVIDIAYYADTPSEHVDEMRAIVESATFELP